jgi:hypothetical protein
VRRCSGLAVLLALLFCSAVACTIEPRSSVSAIGSLADDDSSPPLRWSMQKWREVREEADAAITAPMGDKQISRCEEFLRKYPDYPDTESVLRTLVDATLAKGKPDFQKLDGLLQQVFASKRYITPDMVLEGTYLQNDFPPEMSQRAADKVREALARERAKLALEPDPAKRSAMARSLVAREVGLARCEGRILLARHDYAGAVRRLLEAEASDVRSGSMSLVLVDPNGAARAGPPNGTIASDRLNLALASAYAGAGKREEATERLDRFRGFLASFFPDVTREVARVRKELALQAPEEKAVRSDPTPSSDFRFKDLQGRQVALSDFRGRVVLIMFWATW